MNKYLLLSIISVCVAFMAVPLPLLLAQGSSSEERADEEAADEEMSQYMSGTVVDINPASRIMAVRDEGDSELYTMSVKRSATISGASSLSDISIGDVLNIDYYTVGDRLIATNIVVDEKAAKEEAPATVGKVLVD